MTIGELNALCSGTFMERLGIRYDLDEQGQLIALMPVTGFHKQPFGYLHGGATIALAESLSSAASLYLLEGKSGVMGTQVNTQHLSSVKSGIVKASAHLIFNNDKIHIWDVSIVDDNEQLISISRITNRILSRE
jgi:1,4-dihydroxy-2-naphthoyl-CoA hydrolase